MEPLEDDPSARRSSIRFSSAVGRRHFDPEEQLAADTTMSETRNEENMFRAPLLPPSCLKKKREPKAPLKPMNQGNVQLSISPGTTATEDKKAAMLRKLEKRRSVNQARWAKEKENVQVLDMSATERSFLEQSEVPEPRFSDISMITPSDTFIMTTPRRSQGPVCSTPFKEAPQKQPLRRRSSFQAANVTSSATASLLTQSEAYESAEDIADRQFNALSVWCNMLLNTCNRFDDGTVDLGRTKNDASKKLQELLSKQTKATFAEQPQKFTYTEFLQRQEFETLRTRAMKVYRAKEVPQKIIAAMQNDSLTIRDGSNIYSDISLKTTLLAIFLSFHPVWLHLGMETVFGRAIDVPNGGSFLSTMIAFINTRVFSDPEIMKKKKFAYGSVKMIITPLGRETLHRHFLTKMCQFLYCVEECKVAGVISSDPRLFVRKSVFKSLNDVFSELSREVLSASGSSMGKMFAKCGFTPSIKQGYFDDLEYRITAITDLYDGVMLGKLLEVVCGLGRGTVMCKLRNPGGDRLRKVTNVTNVIEHAMKAGIDCGNVKPESIVGGNKEAILELMWRLVGVFVLASDSNSDELRRESLRLHLTTDLQPTVGEKQDPEDFLLKMCQRLGIELGITVNCLDDLRDGRFLASLWMAYNRHGYDVYSYPGSSLFKRVVAAAETELGLPVGLHGSLPLFVHMFLTRIFNIRRMNEAAARIQKAYRTHLFFRRLKAYLSSEEWAREKEERQRRLSMRDKTYVVATSSGEDITQQDTILSLVFSSASSPNNRSSQWETTFHDYEDREAGRLALEKITEEVRNKAAVTIQTATRGYLARRLFKRLCGERDEYIRKVVIVQNMVRAFIARRQLKRLQSQLEERRNKSAAVIQRAYRCFSARQKLQLLKEQRYKFIHAVTVVQTCIRGFLDRRRFAVLKEEKRKAEEEERKRQLEEERRLAEERERQEEEERQRRVHVAVVKIQALWRGFLARKAFCQLKEEERRRAEEELQRQREEEERQRKLQEELERKKREEEERLRKEEEERLRREEQERLAEEERLRQLEEERRLAEEMERKKREEEERLRREEEERQRQEDERRRAEEERLRREEEERQRQLEEERRLAEEERLKQLEEERRRAEEEMERKKKEEEERLRQEEERLKREEEERRLAEEERQRQEEERLRQLEEERLRREEEEERQRQAPIIRIQKTWRGHLVRKRVAAIKEDRERYVQNVVRVQSAIRGFLTRNRIRNQIDESIRSLAGADEAPEEEPQQPAAPSPRPAISDDEKMERLRRLYIGMMQVKQRQAACEQALRALKNAKAANREAKLKSSSATMIQKTWRGYRVRRRLAKEIETRNAFLGQYKNDAAAQEDVDDHSGRHMPAFKRLEMMEGQLFDHSLYRVKVAATVIGRVVALSPMLARHFALRCGGINAVLDRLEQCDRSPPMQEIIALTLKIFLRLTDLAQSDLEVAAMIESSANDCQKVVFHQFHAFYQNQAIVVDCSQVLTDIRSVASDVVTEKAPFYINQAERRFARLPDSDARKTALRRLQAAFPR